MRRPHLVFWVEGLLALASGTLTVLTLVWRDWIEILLHIDPDRSDGSIEWFLVLVLLATTVVLTALAQAEWRRAGGPVPRATQISVRR